MTTITLQNQEIGLAINALDFYSRIWIGQYKEILWQHRFCLNCEEIQEIEDAAVAKLQFLRRFILPKLGPFLDASYGIFNPMIDERAAMSYNLQQTIRYKYAWAKFPEGKDACSFYKPMQSGAIPLPDATIEEIQDNWFVHISGKTEEDSKKYKDVLEDALTVCNCLMEVDIPGLFSYYTDDPKALQIAGQIQELYRNVKKTEASEAESKNCKLLLEKLQSCQEETQDEKGEGGAETKAAKKINDN